MKKKMKKLHLAKETIAHLDNPELLRAHGGFGTMETECCPSMQPCSVINCYTDTRPVPSA